MGIFADPAYAMAIGPTNLIWILFPLLMVAGHWRSELQRLTSGGRAKYVACVAVLTLLSYSSISMLLYLVGHPIEGPTQLIHQSDVLFSGLTNLIVYLAAMAVDFSVYILAVGIAVINRSAFGMLLDNWALIVVVRCSLTGIAFLNGGYKDGGYQHRPLLFWCLAVVTPLIVTFLPFLLVRNFLRTVQNVGAVFEVGKSADKIQEG